MYTNSKAIFLPVWLKFCLPISPIYYYTIILLTNVKIHLASDFSVKTAL